MAFVIISAGPVTNPSLRTIAAGRLALAFGSGMLLLMTACIGLGYGLAVLRGSVSVVASATSPTTLDHPDGQVIARYLGSLAGRMARLEGEAAALGKRLGLDLSDAVPPPDRTERPAGGPYIPLAGVAALPASFAHTAGLEAPDLATLESQLDQLAAGLAVLAEATAEREVEFMAYPDRLPLAGTGVRIGSTFGVRRDPFTGRLARHTGLDIPAAYGTPILASGGGRVVSAGYKGAYGRAVVIDHGEGLSTLYGHASKLLVRVGDVVMPNQPIALVGSSGRSTGAHLHFEVIRNGVRVEPRQYLAKVLPREARR